MKNIRIKAIQEIQDELVLYTKATITHINTKITRKGIVFYTIVITDGLKKITVWILPKYFEQEMPAYKNKSVDDYGHPNYKINDKIDLINFINIHSSMKLKCVKSKDMLSMDYFLLRIEKEKIMTFKYTTTNEINKNSDILSTKKNIEDIQNFENYKGYIDYKIALENISIFEELVFQNTTAEIIIYNLDEEMLETYKKIFNFIANGGNLIYHKGGIVKRLTLKRQQELKYKKELLKDMRFRFHGCFVGSGNYTQEHEICSLIFEERDKFQNT